MSKFTIKQIFIDNWDKFVSENQELIIRPVVFKEVERMINCGNPEFGYAMYYCEHCDKFMHVPFRCKSRYGFYVYAKPDDISSIKLTVDYVVRYTGRPAMAQSRILNYDGKYVTFYYERHEDNKRIEETIHVFEFIKKLIIHIPDEHFKVVRYYGLYSKQHKHSSKIFKMLSQTQIEIRQQLKKWRLSIELSFGYDPTKCSCGNFMTFFKLMIPQKNTIASTGPPIV